MSITQTIANVLAAIQTGKDLGELETEAKAAFAEVTSAVTSAKTDLSQIEAVIVGTGKLKDDVTAAITKVEAEISKIETVVKTIEPLLAQVDSLQKLIALLPELEQLLTHPA
jgi:predicted  nucleic acid-binding Zn-ribbon protein